MNKRWIIYHKAGQTFVEAIRPEVTASGALQMLFVNEGGLLETVLIVSEWVSVIPEDGMGRVRWKSNTVLRADLEP